MLNTIRPALVLFVLLTAVTGLLYPAAITGIASAAFPDSAGGSLLRDGQVVIGSRLIGQNFEGAGFLHPRPSNAGKGYEANNSGATNFAPGGADLRDAVAGRIQALRADGFDGPVPADLVTASGSGLDPAVSVAAARAQAGRIAAARGVPVTVIAGLIDREASGSLLGFLGEPSINVLLFNRQLDQIAPQPKT